MARQENQMAHAIRLEASSVVVEREHIDSARKVVAGNAESVEDTRLLLDILGLGPKLEVVTQ